ncbi:amino acid adenylation domain-containing protein [Kitasatospora purpeofusca]|uniref:amino acid adenylation domain-containing protein n=2 Tax=Kitasatospora purpeofusca TaxID=67352 RepID=UPI00224D3F56|nr:amino acid adenylation domain-containing protein [Kitasatospora purpeofusca]MCX4688803.1 amino acid adenylation domain-containing protein [Kitasatospora purpeofusca]
MDSGRHAVLVNEDGQYTIWLGDFTVPSGWRTVFGPAGRAECRRYVEREWRAPGLGMGPGGPGRAVGGGARNAGRRGLADTVHGLVRARAAHDPDAVAVVTDEETLTYRELDTRSDRLAGVLRGLGVGPERVVPVCLERGADLVTALLGVLKAGGAFLPLDPAHPRRRLARLVEDCGADVVVSADGLPFPGVRAVAPDGGADATVDMAPGEDPAGPDDLAYLIYTSGTTGTPKGVPVTHRSLVFTLDRVVHAYGLTARDRVLQLAALGFDTSLEQVFATLAAGATLVLGGARTWAPTELAHRMRELRLTVADLTPAYWHHLLGLFPPGGPAPEGLRLIIVGGDTVHADDCRACLERLPGVRLVNAYGVTEAAVTSTLCELTPEALEPGAQHAGPGHPSAAPVPIGRPLPGVRLHLLDARLSPVPPGEKGEIHLGGPGLARGYWRAPGLTAETFLPDPYAQVPGERMYRTGDAGRWRADGNLEILGRFDDQLKVRGHRVDPAEVESVLAAHPDVRQARVAAEGSADGSRVLIAYYTLTERAASGPHARRGRIRSYLAERLPDFMVPADFVLLDSMPLTPAGKIDRRRLPEARPQLQRRDGQEAGGGGDPTGARRAGAARGAPSPNGSAPNGAAPNGAAPAGGTATAVEAGVAQLWSELLGVEEVGPDDDFFDLGGNSLLAMEMLARARIMFGIDVTRIRFLTRSLLRDATLRAFAADTLAARTGGPARADGSAQAQDPAGGEAAVDWAAEARLATPVRQSWSPAPSRAEPTEILLTGATGFCGAHLLDALLHTTAARIHCLVRAPDEEHALERLRAAQQRFLRQDLADRRVVPLVGDLAEPLLGLTQQRFEHLANTLDAIHHLGGLVNFIYPYHQLRAANVDGTREIVRLAGHSRGIPVHYLSTLAVVAGFGAAGIPEVTERTPLDHADRLAVGYVESKWVAEQLLHHAAEAGLPVTVLRTNDVTGDLRTGVMNTGTEMCALIKYMAESGSCPDVRLPLDFVPADRFSRAICHIVTHAPANGEVYHLTSPTPAGLPELAERLRARGHPVDEVPYEQWVQGLVRFAAGHPTHPMTPFVPLFVDRVPGTELSISEMYFRPTFPRFDRANTEHALAGSGVVLPAVDGGLLDFYLDRLTAEGFLSPPLGTSPLGAVR